MKKFSSIEEIREEIDEVDIQILDLIFNRKKLVTEVVKLKKRNQIIDNKRIEDILVRLRKEASKRDIPEDFVEEVWKLMIKTFIAYEEKIFDEIHKLDK